MVFSVKTVNLTKKFADLTAVDGINIEIKQGETIGFLGPNGAGKTTTINMLCTLLKPTSGKAEICGIDVSKYPVEVRKKIGIIFQEPSSDDMLSGYENLYLHAMLYGMDSSIAKERIKFMLSLTGLERKSSQQVRTYSGGMRRRLEIARGLLHEPEVLFLDEPTLGLDPAARRDIWTYLEKIKSFRKTTIILTTHYMEEADALSDRIAVIDKGKIIAFDTPCALKSQLGEDIILLKGCVNEQIAKLPFVTNFEKRGDYFTITVKSLTQNIKTLINEAGDISEMEIRRVSLEDVFLKLTGKSISQDDDKESGSVFESIVRYNSIRK